LVTSPIARTLERVAIGSGQHGLVEADQLVELFDGIPKLRMLELRAPGMLHEERMLAIEKLDRLESLALWTPGNDSQLERLIAAPWPRLTALAVNGRGPGRRALPAGLAPLLDGTRHPALDQLTLMDCGFEGALVTELARRPLGKRLRALGLDWRMVEDATLEEAGDDFANIELIWPRPVGVNATADDEYQLARRLRLGLDRDRKALVHATHACELEPNNYFHWTEVGYVHEALDQLPEKLAAMDRAIEIDRERWGGWAGRGSALRDRGRRDEARAAY
nr:hypothetical protein [Deltaproteobacteria bacterium]